MEWIFVVALTTIIITIKWIIDGTQGKAIIGMAYINKCNSIIIHVHVIYTCMHHYFMLEYLWYLIFCQSLLRLRGVWGHAHKPTRVS